MGRLINMIEAATSQREISLTLDSLSHEERLREVESVAGEAQRRLYRIAAADLKLQDLIPAGILPLQEVIFYGKNSLPLFSTFQKRMCRSKDGLRVWGYNFQSLGWLTGPGYFGVADDSDRSGEILVDYTKTPQDFPADWPSFQPNNKGVSRFVYDQMKDYLRRVSKNVFIGEATKRGKSMNQYFLLCRFDR
jgi:hypothetical protein